MLGEAVGERRHRAPAPAAARPPRRRAAPRTAACTDRARGACSGAAGSSLAPARRGQREIVGHRRAARRPARSDSHTPSAVDLERARRCRRPRSRRRRRASTTPPSAAARPRRRCASSCAPTNESSAPVRDARRSAASRSRSRPRRARCAPGRRRASPTRRASRRRAPRRTTSSGTGVLGIGDERHVLHERGEARLADQAVGDRPGRERAVGRPPELVADERGHAGARRPRRASPRPRRASSANGFSQITCRPASHASIASGACACGRRRDRDRVDARRARARRRATCTRAGRRAARRGGAVRSASRPTSATHVEARPRAARARARARRTRCRRPTAPGTRLSSPRRDRRPRAAARPAMEPADVVDEDRRPRPAGAAGVYQEMCAAEPHLRVLVQPVARRAAARDRRCRASPSRPGRRRARRAARPGRRARRARCSRGARPASPARARRRRSRCRVFGRGRRGEHEMVGARQRGRRAIARPRTPATGLGASVRRSACTCMSNAQRPARDRGPDPAEADERERAARRRESSGGRGKFQCFGGSCSHVCGMRFAHASIAAITHSEIGIALAPRAHVTIRPS